MDHSFKDRVDKVFGSISSSSSSTPWSLTGAQVEKRVWNRDKGDKTDVDDETLVSSSFDNMFNSKRNRRKGFADLSDDDEDGQIGGDDSVQTENDGDVWEIRSSIGLDSTLDNEEEEDAYDKMAEGRENAGERLYMKDVTDHGPYLNSHNVLPTSVHQVKKDPRANHDAAKTRLKEDDNDDPVSADEQMLNAEEPSVTPPRIKSILKRKSDDVAVKPAKRVRFDSSCKTNDEELANSVQMSGFVTPKVSENGRNVPDYVMNPSKYTRYDFGDASNDVNDNEKAYKEFLEQVKKSNEVELDQKSGESSSSSGSGVVFIPRKKRSENESEREEASNVKEQVKESSSNPANSGIGIGIAVQEDETSEMQEDDESHVEGVSSKSKFQKPGQRRYRSKMEEDEDV